MAPAESKIPSMAATLCSYQGFFGPYHPQTLSVATLLAEELLNNGDRATGQRLLERALEDLTKHHSPHHPLRLRALEAWGLLLRQDRDWPRALPVQRELAGRLAELHGPDHPSTIAAVNDLAAVLSSLMRGDAASA
jgi:hypothetical protein